jgi:hypothetical protein
MALTSAQHLIRQQRAAQYREYARSLRAMTEDAPTDQSADQLRGLSEQYDRLAEQLEATLRS